MALACKPLLITDGYALNNSDGYGYTSPWICVQDMDVLCFSVSLVGGTPQGTLSLQQSCQVEANIGAAMGGGGASPIYPVPTGPATKVPLLADPYRGSQYVNDTATVPAGNGVATVNVNGASTYVLNQWLFGYSFVRVVFASNTNVNTAITIWLSMKG